MISRKQLHVFRTKSGVIQKYMQTLEHAGLKETKQVTAPDKIVLEGKIIHVIAAWEKKWQKKQATELKDVRSTLISQIKRRAKEHQTQLTTQSIEYADTLTREAKNLLKSTEEILSATLSVNDAVDWGTLKNLIPAQYEHWIELRTSDNFPVGFIPEPAPEKPQESEYKLKMPFWRRFLGLEKPVKVKQTRNFQEALRKWQGVKKTIECTNEQRKQIFLELQQQEKDRLTFNAKIDEFAEKYKNSDSNSIEEYCEIVLNNSKYPDFIKPNFHLQYMPENKTLIVDYTLPAIEDIPTLTSVRYIKSKAAFEEKHLSPLVLQKTYDNLIYQILLRTIHELFEADAINALDLIGLNGLVASINRANGKEEIKCIASMQVKKSEFLEINLAQVDPKQCFKALKGVAATQLHSLSPIPPILKMDRHDERFVEHYNVVNKLDESVNIAAMDWQDFEHLVRELFEKIYAKDGGEVRVTRASADGGVDAVIFDPNPIRGGKIVIQAKRYTNTVTVEAVRALWGTVGHEGAMKGILITTATYGPDAYDFAKSKPLLLINGNELLHMLAEHGHKVRIDIAEARKLLKNT